MYLNFLNKPPFNLVIENCEWLGRDSLMDALATSSWLEIQFFLTRYLDAADSLEQPTKFD